jgi:hypothetical protein
MNIKQSVTSYDNNQLLLNYYSCRAQSPQFIFRNALIFSDSGHSVSPPNSKLATKLEYSLYIGLGSFNRHQVFTKIRQLNVAGKLASPKCQTKSCKNRIAEKQ